MIFGETFNKIFKAIERLEKHIGLTYYTDQDSINGRLNNLMFEQKNKLVPYCERDIPIIENVFFCKFKPIKIGDSWIVNNIANIHIIQDGVKKKFLSGKILSLKTTKVLL